MSVIVLILHVIQLLAITFTLGSFVSYEQIYNEESTRNLIANQPYPDSSYGYQKCMFVDSSIEYIGPPIVFTIE
jgi:hypothetical protein